MSVYGLANDEPQAKALLLPMWRAQDAGGATCRHAARNQLIADGARMKLKLTCCLLLFLFCTNATARAQGAGKRREVAERTRRYEPYLAESATKHGIDARLLWVIAWLETRFNPAAVSRKGARGLMQMMPATARRFDLKNPHEPAAAIDAAARYVRLLVARYGGRADLVLAAYNAGEAAVDAYLTGRAIQAGNKVINPRRRITGGIPPYRETREYVANGLRILDGTPSSFSSVIQRKHRPEGNSAGDSNREKETGRASVRSSVSYAVAPEQNEDVSSSKMRRSISW